MALQLKKIETASVIETTQQKHWYAWVELPKRPSDFYVVGSVLVPNPGVEASLFYKEPQGINPAMLLLDLVLVQQPGNWPQVQTWKQVKYHALLPIVTYTTVQVFSGNEAIAEFPVHTVYTDAPGTPPNYGDSPFPGSPTPVFVHELIGRIPRVYTIGDPLTKDFRLDRVNIEKDTSGRIGRIWIG